MIDLIRKTSHVMTTFLVMTCSVYGQNDTIVDHKIPQKYSRFYTIQNSGLWAFFELTSLFNSNPYYLFIPLHQSYLMARITENIHTGIYLGTARSLSSHKERFLGNWAGMRVQYQKQMKPNLRIFTAVELGSELIYSKTLQYQTRPDSLQVFIAKNYNQYLMPVNIGIQIKLNRKHNERVDVFWSPELQYNFPIGFQYEKFSKLQRINFDLFRISFEFKK